MTAIVQQMTELLGYKRRSVVPALVEKPKPVQSPVAAKAKEEVVSSPDSCVLSGPGSSVRSPNHAVNDRGSVSILMDPSDHNSSKCSYTENLGELRNSESSNSDVEDSDQAGYARNKINVDRIRALMRARKRSRECSKSKEDADEISEDVLIERELKAGVELAAGSFKKKQRLLDVL